MQIALEAKKTESTAWIKRNVNKTIDIKGTVCSEWKFHPFITHHDVSGDLGDIF